MKKISLPHCNSVAVWWEYSKYKNLNIMAVKGGWVQGVLLQSWVFNLEKKNACQLPIPLPLVHQGPRDPGGANLSRTYSTLFKTKMFPVDLATPVSDRTNFSHSLLSRKCSTLTSSKKIEKGQGRDTRCVQKKPSAKRTFKQKNCASRPKCDNFGELY